MGNSVDASAGERQRAAVTWPGYLVRLGLLVAAILVVAVWEYQLYGATILRLDHAPLTAADRVLIFGSLASKSVVLVLPQFCLGMALGRLGRRRLAILFTQVLPLLTLAYLAADVKVQTMTGLHMSYYLARSLNVAAWQWGGDMRRFVVPPLLVLTGGAIASGVLFAVQPWLDSFARRLTQRTGRRLSVGLLGGLAGGVLGVLMLRGYSEHPWTLERLYASLPTSALLFGPDSMAGGGVAFTDDAEPLFQPVARQLYRAAHAPPGRLPPLSLAERSRPNVIVLFIESFQYGSISEKSMPRLTRWAEDGLRLDRHYSGSNCSPLGAFGLLYGRLPINYDATLDAGFAPPLCTLLEREGYETVLVASCVFTYMRMEEYFSQDAFDSVSQHVMPSGSWHEADAKTLEEIARRARVNDAAPQFLVGYLMSTHYSYDSPPDYQKRFAVAGTAEPGDLLRRRYAASLRYLDDQLAQFLEQLDPAENIVVIAGDHGESIYEDGFLTHGSRLSDIQSRTPCVIRGPGIPREQVKLTTAHVDVLPTVLHALSGRPQSDAWFHGRDLLMPRVHRPQLLTQIYSDAWDLMLLDDRRRLLMNLSRRQPRLRIIGFADSNGNVDPSQQLPATRAPDWVHSLDQIVQQSLRPPAASTY